MCIHINFPAPAPSFTLLLLCKFYHHHASPLFLLLLLSLFFPATAQQPISPSSPQDSLVANMRFDKTIASVLVILVMVIFSLGFILIYTRQCRERRIRGRIDLTVPINGNGCRPPHGLDPKIIENFPSFVYLEVKNHKIGRVTLECCVCLNEFKDDETLRLITNCSHVFHRDCVDAWLLHHSTCPVCRADLDLGPGDDSLSVEIPILDTIVEPNLGELVFNRERDVIEPVDLDDKKKIGVVNSIVHYDGMNCPVRSKSTGFMFARLFSPSNSMDQLMVQSNQDCERFTLRLPNEVHNRLVNDITLTRAKSLGGTLSSGRSGYRTKSVGRSFLRYEQLNVESHSKKRGFMGVPRSFLSRVGSIRSTKDGNKATTMELMDEIYVGERSLNRLVSNN